MGTLATEDILPLWAAQAEGLFENAGLNVQVVAFQSATELIAGVASGEVNLAMTDIMVTASMFASDVDVQMPWVTLGTQADQGRFGIMVGPDSSISSLTDLAGVPIGVGSNTILEYVMDKLMEDAGVPDDQIRAAVRAGIRKINFGTDVCCALLNTFKEVDPKIIAVDLFMKQPTQAVKAFALEKIALLGSEGTND